jgi:hypothetical protein
MPLFIVPLESQEQPLRKEVAMLDPGARDRSTYGKDMMDRQRACW